jgi:TRAP-type mannitol/chloroaromatic compound transport system substrate-binding protein
MNRREFLQKGGVAAAAAGTVVAAPTTSAAAKYRWKMVTTWPPKFPVFQTGAESFARRCHEMSDGRLDIKVFAGGELVPPMGVFDAVAGGMVALGHSSAYYWAGKLPAAQFFSAVPFGFTGQQMNAWLYHGGGLELWRELYAPYNLIPFPVTNTGVQMGGWFNREINSLKDLAGLKMRIPGLGGKVMGKAGVNVVLLPGAELYTALERGVIDALEWVGPYHDMKLGFHRAAKYYYYPGWHEPGTVIELIVNRAAWATLPDDLKAIVEAAAAQTNIESLGEVDALNAAALRELTDKHKVKLRRFPDEVIAKLRELTRQTLDELAASDPKAKKVYDAFKNFAATVEPWTEQSETAFMRAKSSGATE